MKSQAIIPVFVLLGIGSFLWGQEPIPEHAQIQGPFKSGPEVTQKCLECHEESGSEVIKTSHWTWSLKQDIEARGEIYRGKKDAINNYCIALSSNWPRCTSCHIGYGWKDASFDFKDQSMIDCLVCHDTTGSYKKTPTGAGMPMMALPASEGQPARPGVDLLLVARNVGKPTRAACGTCHFFGGGGDGIKHGDLDTSLTQPELSLDVHMSPQGLDFSCQDCHTTEEHVIQGSALVVSPGGRSHVRCIGCHDRAPHSESLIDKHTERLACQTCHVPAMARQLPTKISWDWSTAGQDREPQIDEFGKPLYDKKKGSFVWDKNIIPSYLWYNGSSIFYELGDRFDPDATLVLNGLLGDRSDKTSRLYPFKLHTGSQIYDAVNSYLIIPKLFGPGGYWATWDWDQAAELGMESVDLPYSGEYGWVNTVMHWKLNHMVAPAEDALKCLDCHGDHSRLDWKGLGYDKDPLQRKTP